MHAKKFWSGGLVWSSVSFRANGREKTKTSFKSSYAIRDVVLMSFIQLVISGVFVANFGLQVPVDIGQQKELSQFYTARRKKENSGTNLHLSPN